MFQNSKDEKDPYGRGRSHSAVPHPISEDMAGNHDVRHDLHKRPLLQRGGYRGTEVVDVCDPNEYLTSHPGDQGHSDEEQSYNPGRGYNLPTAW